MRLLFGGKGFAGRVPSPVQRAKGIRNQVTRLLIFSHSSEGLEWVKFGNPKLFQNVRSGTTI